MIPYAYLNIIEVAAALEAQHSVHGQLREVILPHVPQLGRQRFARNVQQVLFELGLVRAIVDGGRRQRFTRDLHRLPPARHDSHGVYPLVHQELGLSQQLSAQDSHANIRRKIKRKR